MGASRCKVASAPGTGAKVQALGFGHCAGQKENLKERIGTVRNRDSEAVVIDVPLCKGDTGGAGGRRGSTATSSA